MSAKVAVEEFIIGFDGTEKVTKVWPSVSECSLDLEVDPRTIRQRINCGRGMTFSMGTVKYRRV